MEWYSLHYRIQLNIAEKRENGMPSYGDLVLDEPKNTRARDCAVHSADSRRVQAYCCRSSPSVCGLLSPSGRTVFEVSLIQGCITQKPSACSSTRAPNILATSRNCTKTGYADGERLLIPSRPVSREKTTGSTA